MQPGGAEDSLSLGVTEEEKGPLPGRNWGDTLSFRQRKNGRDDQERNVFFFFFLPSFPRSDGSPRNKFKHNRRASAVE